MYINVKSVAFPQSRNEIAIPKEEGHWLDLQQRESGIDQQQIPTPRRLCAIATTGWQPSS
jgi:hypothetical protein